MPNESSDPLDPLGLGVPEPLGLDVPSPLASPAPLLPSSIPNASPGRAAADLPFALGGPLTEPTGAQTYDGDTDGIPVGLPDFSSLMGVAPPPEAAVPVPQAPSAPWPDAGDDDVMALPSPSMIGPSPFGPDGLGAPEDTDDGGFGLPGLTDEGEEGAEADVRSIHSDVTEQEQLPPTPVFGARRVAPGERMVPATVLVEALRELEGRHMRNLAIAFMLGALSSVIGFVAARWALTQLG